MSVKHGESNTFTPLSKPKLLVRVLEVRGFRGDIFCEIRKKDDTHYEKTPVIKEKFAAKAWPDQEYSFTVVPHDSILVKVYHDSLLGSNDLCGAVTVPVSSLAPNAATNATYNLMADAHCRKIGHGQIQLLFNFVTPQQVPAPVVMAKPAPGSRLSITILEAKMKHSGDLYCEIRLKNTSTCVQTPVVTCTKTPQWNMMFDFFPSNPDRDIFQLKIYDKGLVSNSLQGAVEIPVSSVAARGFLDDWWSLGEDLISAKIKTRGQVHVMLNYLGTPAAVQPVQIVQAYAPGAVPQPYGAPAPYPQQQPQHQQQPQYQPQVAPAAYAPSQAQPYAPMGPTTAPMVAPGPPAYPPQAYPAVPQPAYTQPPPQQPHSPQPQQHQPQQQQQYPPQQHQATPPAYPYQVPYQPAPTATVPPTQQYYPYMPADPSAPPALYPNLAPSAPASAPPHKP